MQASVRDDGGGRGVPWRPIGWGAVALLLLLPLVTNAPWTLLDYVVMGALFGLVGLGLEFAVRNGNRTYTLAAGVALAAAFLLVWIAAAVGIIGSENEDANLLFVGVVALALLGAMGSLFRANGMALAMAAAALAQALVPVLALTFWPQSASSVWAPEVFALTGFFTGMWLLSAWLFRKSAQ